MLTPLTVRYGRFSRALSFLSEAKNLARRHSLFRNTTTRKVLLFLLLRHAIRSISLGFFVAVKDGLVGTEKSVRVIDLHQPV